MLEVNVTGEAEARLKLSLFSNEIDKATKAAMRAVGTKAAAAARARTPVFQGGPGTTISIGGRHYERVPGTLKKSVRSARSRSKSPKGTNTILIGPMTPAIVRVYRHRVNEKSGFMEAAQSVAANGKPIFEAAYDAAIAKQGGKH